ncbi:hypothetical protein [Methylovulum miyakonense]|uniref:hypothetical protein n=1 Tax=Methylovulum miyakonense TaxID=645578 RepID=UPI0003748E84|nr:hypothetical protein [Methylovulum miyakonense]
MLIKPLLAITLLVALQGCGTTAKFVYPADVKDVRHIGDTFLPQSKVAVTPFKEKRGDENQSGTYWLYLIPLMPYGYGTYQRPEAARMFNTISEFEFNVSEDLAKASVYSLKEAGVFQDVFFTFGGDKDKADYLLEGEVLSTDYEGKLWTYGLSVQGPLLWLVGLPVGTSKNVLDIGLKLTNLHTNAVVWHKEYKKDTDITQGLYYKDGYDARGYTYLMQDIMNEAVEDIRQAISRK